MITAIRYGIRAWLCATTILTIAETMAGWIVSARRIADSILAMRIGAAPGIQNRPCWKEAAGRNSKTRTLATSDDDWKEGLIVGGGRGNPEGRRWRSRDTCRVTVNPRTPYWQLSHRADPEARIIADNHYNRQKPGTPQFVPPGRCLVLKRPGAFWVTSFPFARYVKHEWAGAWVCSAFRREYGPLASELIREAVARTVQYHFDKPSWAVDPLPSLGMVTFIDERKVREKANFGYCYLKAGFVVEGRTKKDDLLALRLPLTAALALWVEFYPHGELSLG